MKKLLLAFCILFSALGEAQTWTNYTKSNTSTQLPSDTINQIIQDKDSSIWFATNNGVSHFKDGIWKNFYVNDGLSSNVVKTIAIDTKGNKWFGTTMGLNKFDGVRWTTYNTTNGLKQNYIQSLAVDLQDNVWLVANGLSKFDGNMWTSYSPTNSPINCVSTDNKGNVWIGTESGISKFNGSSWISYGYSTIGSSSGIISIGIDSKGTVWFGAYAHDLISFDGINWKSQAIGGTIQSIGIDSKKDNLWVGRFSGGASLWNGSKWIDYPPTPNGLVNYCVNSILVDFAGNIWFGTNDGVSKYDGSNWTLYHTNGLADNFAKEIAIDTQNNKWFCTSNGVSVFNGISWTRYSVYDGLVNNHVNSIAFESNGTKWFGTDDGISKYDGKIWTTYKKKDGLADNLVNTITIDKEGNKWIGTYYGGVSKFDGSIWTTYNKLNGLVDNNVRDIAIDAKGNKWFCTANGVSVYDDITWTTYNKSTGVNIGFVWNVTIDAYDNKWFTNMYNLVKFDGINWIYSLNYKSPLLINDVNAISIDEYGNMWFTSTNFHTRGITKFDGFLWSKYNNVPILAGNSAFATAIDAKGLKWFSADNGIFSLNDGGSGSLLLNKIQKGLVFHDQNSNGQKDPNETTISGQIVKIDNNYTTTQNNGLFYTSLNNGTHTFTYRPQTNWQLTTDSSITVTVTDAPIKDTLYFGVQAIANKHEVETKLTGTATRAGFKSKSWINYSNRGTLAENGTVSYTLADEASLVQTIPTPDSTIGKRLVWKYNNLIPNEQRQISITTQMPGVNYLGDTLVSISKIKSDFASFSDTLKQVLTGSYDPNDKLVAQGIGSKGYVLFGKELEYTVRFQNTGTDTAFNVNIRDTLDLNLDVASLQIVASSHSVKLDLRGQNEATFRFENIKLPHQKRDTLGSNGFVKYTIKPKKNLPENTPVKNKAHIYFDFNPAIITNETVNTYVSKLPSLVTGIQGFQSNKSAIIFPNPAKDEFTIVFPQTGTYEISLANIQGKSIKTWNEILGQETTLSLEGLEPGLYLYTAQGSNGQKFMGKLVIGR